MGTEIDWFTGILVFALRQARQMPFLDAVHRDIWNGWLGAWHGKVKTWRVLRPADNAIFVDWYVGRINDLVEKLCDLDTTAHPLTGEVRPLVQTALTRLVFQLQDVVTRIATSDPDARTTWALLALARFDDLGWSFERMTSGDEMTKIMEPLAADATIGDLYQSYASLASKSCSSTAAACLLRSMLGGT